MLLAAPIPRLDPFGRNPFLAVRLGSKPSPRFRTDWVWSSTGPGTAHATVTVTPTVAGRSLRMQARLPDGVDLIGDELSRTIESLIANVPVILDFDLEFPVDRRPVVVVDVLLFIAEGNQDAEAIPVFDTGTPLEERSPADWPSVSGASQPISALPKNGGEVPVAAPTSSQVPSVEPSANIIAPVAVAGAIIAAVLLLS